MLNEMKSASGGKFLRRGFTLIELLIVIVIIGILATIAIVNYGSQSAKARGAATVQTMNDAANAAAICVAGGSTTIAPKGGDNICNDTTVTSVKWPPATLNDTTITYGAGGTSVASGTVTWVISATAASPNKVDCTAGASCVLK